MVLNVLPILGPSRRITAITTIATRARMIAYSTSPWPCSLGANNMVNSFLIELIVYLRSTIRISPSINNLVKISTPLLGQSFTSLLIFRVGNPPFLLFVYFVIFSILKKRRLDLCNQASFCILQLARYGITH